MNNNDYILYDDPLRYYHAMLEDIEQAKSYIYLETYRFNNDSIGIKFRDALTRKCTQGLDVKLLLDSWGTSVSSNFFGELQKHGGEVRYFQKIKFFLDFFTKNHRRNHRKLLIIDDRISYLGSANYTEYSLNWRESMLRIGTDLSLVFKKIFLEDFRIYNKYVFEKLTYIRRIRHRSFEVIRDVPSLTKQRIRKRYLRMIRSANSEIMIETPYFLPGSFVRKALMDAARRDVSVKIIMPKHSDVGLIDVLRNRYLGILHKNGVGLLFYTPHNLHAKLILVDRETFSVGSPNFDYRSFRYQHEIALVGEEPGIVAQIEQHLAETIKNCEVFDYEKWLRRPKIQRFFEWLLGPFRHLL